jgi:hypothetical protein
LNVLFKFILGIQHLILLESLELLNDCGDGVFAMHFVVPGADIGCIILSFLLANNSKK